MRTNEGGVKSCRDSIKYNVSKTTTFYYEGRQAASSEGSRSNDASRFELQQTYFEI